MSGYLVLSQTGERLRSLFFEALKAKGLNDGARAADVVAISPPPASGSGDVERTLSLWLYLVSENEHLKNRPPTINKYGVARQPPLGLSLYYLLTPGRRPGGDTTGRELEFSRSIDVLGVALETIHNTPVLLLSHPTAPAPAEEELHLSLCRMNLEELARIWEALDHPFRLSVCLKVNVVRIESARNTKATPIVERDFAITRLERAPAP